ncbi:MAG: Uma2 family endonuclease [Firmicutes bacterium]|nr:Uma2 family endonuclease [Bacillota bacterium]
MKIEEMKAIKAERGYSNKHISEKTGIPLGTVRKIFSGETKQPRFETMQALEKLFNDPHAPSYPGPVYDFYPGQPPVLVKERNTVEDYRVYKDGTYTASDLDRLRGDNGRGELIDGVLFNMASPPVSHQLIQTELVTHLTNYVKSNGGNCLPLTCPLDVHIEKDDKTVLQPDILVLCDRGLIRDGIVWGGPDLVIEILSPSTRDRDLIDKLYKYQNGGVREYWIVDPAKERIIVYDFAHGGLIRLHSFQDSIPVGIWDGDCVIDFAPIASEFRSLEE